MRVYQPGASMVPLYKERVLAEAARELSERTRKRRDDWLPIFKRFLKLEEHRLRMWHNAGGGGREIARQHADLIDIVFRELFENLSGTAGGKNGSERFVVAAFGGYGRREMNPFSDVDVMFLTARGKPGERLEGIIRQTLTGLWDLGFKVGHSTRSVAQAVKAANDDMVTKTSMLECRFLLGDRELFTRFKARFERSCIVGKEDAYVKWRFASQEESHEKYGGTVFVQEPNVKNGCGGLRDYQNMLWIAFVTHRLNTTAKLVERRFLRGSERRALEKAYDFLLRVRTEMHYANGRPIDSLTLQLQGKVATAFHYPQKHILGRCEAFMRDYYSHSRDLAQITASALERLDLPAAGSAKSALLSLIGRKAKPVKFDGFQANDGRIFPIERDVFNEDPFRLIRVFQHAQQRQLGLSTELCDLIRRRLLLIDRTFQYARVSREIFLDILSHKGEVGRILRAMHGVGVLGRYLPEFGALTCLVQHEFFHRYTADEHTLVCIEKLDGLLLAEDRKFGGYRSLFQKLEDPAILYLAVLLHDVGKASNTRHHEEQSAMLAHKVARRLQLSPERRRMLVTLVDAHYTLSHTSQTRNLDDPATTAEFAAIVKNRTYLDALMLLTLADGMGTSDQNWSDWKESLVWMLYRKTSEYLEAGPRWAEERRRDRESLLESVRRLLPRDFVEEIAAHFAFMPERYFNAFDAASIVGHLRLFRTFFERRRDPEFALAPVFQWIERPEMGHSEVWVCGWDRERFLERIAGAFLSANINILSADIFTRGDSLALDIFRVCDARHQPVTTARDRDRVESRLLESLSVAEYDFMPLIDEPSRLRSYRLSQEAEPSSRVVVDNAAHPFYTILEIQTPDRLGLLYRLLRALGGMGIAIQTSRITTEMEVALDTFYVTGRDERKITDEAAIERLRRMVQRAAAERRPA
ncbi:MAG: [protein-PII] uridylyltransferase [Terrimicrobiaceae bacterium]|nr:[protein-PII] uridylyltransferase [Terrimicrobiaceae bacterium]